GTLRRAAVSRARHEMARGNRSILHAFSDTLYAMTTSGTTKAVILARGLGTRMRAPGEGNPSLARAQADAVDRGMKSRMPMSDGRPFLDYLLAALAEAGISDVCLVVGPEHGEVRDRYS